MSDDHLDHSIAILAMAGRFPGARDLDSLWRNLAAGVESITFFDEAELRAAGQEPELVSRPGYVKARPVLEEVELFDATFFDLSPREAEILDPQCRLFLECAWEGLERAGYAADRHDGWVGVFAGQSRSSYQRWNLESRPDLFASQGWFPIYLANDRDYFTTRVSYKLNLRGPSMNVQTACSTSLVAVHQACQALLDYQCTLALAGGVCVAVPQTAGYLYEPGGITSPDGHCRPFDAGAGGSIFGSGVGVVVLKRLTEALADGDPVLAVIRGSAVNNDGSAKVGFTAPSVEGQAEVIAMAHAAAAVDPETVTYVEAHGSGTALGDPIEVEALAEAFQAGTRRRGYCALGSVKSNFGHLESAAGIAGLIKAVLMLRHRQIPPTLHYRRPNPRIDFAQTPFYVSAELRPWEGGGGPRRAGVSAFGMGGTNAHVVLEEAPEPEPSGPSRRWQILTLSARTASALEAATDALARHLAAHPELSLADAAFTLQVGRRSFEHRRMLVCRQSVEASRALAGRDPGRLLGQRPPGSGRPVAFLLPGVGEHYLEMGLGPYREEPLFRRELDRYAELLEPRLGVDPRRLLYPRGTAGEASEPGAGGIDLAGMLGRDREAGGGDEATRALDRTRVLQPSLFAVEMALARLWMSWGIEPEAMIGHSLGEYTAACLAGVLSLEDALTLVAERARLIDELPPGAMTAVSLPEAEVAELLGDGLYLAAVNGPQVSVLAGDAGAVEQLEGKLAGDGVSCRRLPTSHAFHTPLMQPAADALTELARRMDFAEPRIPYLSNLTGTWITPAQATDPAYWARHLTGTVRFGDGLTRLLAEPARVLLEVGPGHGLGALALQQAPAGGEESGVERVVIPSLRSAFDHQDDQACLLGAVGRLWLAGVEVDWPGFYDGQRRRRIELPTYPFERKRFWVEPGLPGRPPAAAPGDAGEVEQAGPGTPGASATTRHARPANLTTPYQAPRGELERRIARTWEEVLGIAGIGVFDRYFDMGGHSLLAPRMVQHLERALGISIPLPTFLTHPTVAQLAEVAERLAAGDEAAGRPAAVDLAAEVTLDDAIRPAAGAVAPRRPPEVVFLTGGTGFLGAHLLAQLWAQTGARLRCLARAADSREAAARLRRNLERHRLWRPQMEERIEAVAGDLERPRFGLTPEAFRELAQRLDAVYHAGAWVNFTYPYAVLRAANVDGTREALRLAALGGETPFHFLSSVAVFPSSAPDSGGVVHEDDPLERSEGLFSGYAETKWVCEKILDLARERGLPVAVYRPGVISGASDTGIGNSSDMVWNLLKGSIQLGAAIDQLPVLDVTPVDFVAQAVVRLSLEQASLGRAFHFANPRPLPWARAFDAVEEMGYPLSRLPYAQWRRRLGRAAESGEGNALTPFLPLLEDVPEGEEAAELPSVRYDDRGTREGLAGSGVECPPLDAELIRRYVRAFIADGFLPPPRQGGEGAAGDRSAAPGAEAPAGLQKR